VTRLAVDVGAEVVKVAIIDGGPRPVVLTQPTGTRSRRDALAAALSGASLTRHTPVTVTVPDSWLEGTAEGGRRQEEARHVAEDELGLSAVTWAGQLAAVAALAASQDKSAEPCTYLVCDIGGRGVRAAACEVSGHTVRQQAVRVAGGGGWRGFDAAVRSALGDSTAVGPAATRPAHAEWVDPERTITRGAVGRPSGPQGPGGLPDDWHLAAMEQDRRARIVLDRALDDPAFRDARAYRLGSLHELTAGQVIDCFEPTALRLRECAGSVLNGRDARVAVLTGGLAWLPLAARLLRDLTGAEPVILGADAAARGALLLADEPGIAPEHQPQVSLPMSQIRYGLLAETSRPLPWTWSFAPEDEPFRIEEPRLTLDIGGRRVDLPVPGLANGAYQIGVRPGWSGAGVLVVRASSSHGGIPPGDAVHVLSLDIPA
jgi:hypothetical protein